MPIMGVPTNSELYENAPDTVEEAIHSWLCNHLAVAVDPRWLTWAAKNLRNDPEFLGAMKKEFGID